MTHAVLANDEDPDGDPLSLLSVSTPSHGSATISAGQVRYEPDPDHNGSDAFSYTIGDGRGGTASATVSVSVRSVNDAPVAQPDGTYLVQVGERLLISDLLANDSDVDGDGLSIGQVSDGSVGTVSIVDDATVAYQHGGDTTATTDEFTYRTSDGRTLSDPVTVALHINRPPEAGTDYMRVRARSVTHSVNVITGAAIANCCDSGDGERWSPRTDSDPDGDPVRLVGWEPDTARPAAITGFSCASSGRCDVTIQGCSTVKWSVTYTISDGRGGSDANQFRIESFHSCIE